MQITEAQGMNGEKTAFPGVRIFHNSDGTDSYYIQYRRGGRGSKLINELAGKTGPSGKGGMTAKKAAELRILRMRNIEESNEEKRARIRAEGTQAITIKEVWELYREKNADKPFVKGGDSHNIKHLQALLDKEIRNLSTQDVDRLIARLKKTPTIRQKKKNAKPEDYKNQPVKYLSPQTIKHIVGLLKRLYKYADSRDLCELQKVKFDMQKFDNRKTEYMSETEFEKYLTALDDEADQIAATVIRIALFTGVRKSAILALAWRDIDIERGFIFLAGKNAKKGEGAYIPLPSRLSEHIKALPKESEYLFPGKVPGTHRTTVTRISRRLKKVAGLPEDFRPMHGLRHHFATTMASSGLVSGPTLQALLTHESPAMTSRYTTILDGAMKKAGAIADELFSSKNEVNHGN